MQSAFDKYSSDYEQWFEKHTALYQSEILALEKAIPAGKIGIEIGVGTGRFAVPFGIKTGVEPSAAMAAMAVKKGITVINAVAENLPVQSKTYDFVLMVTTVCFLTDIDKSFSEANRILKDGGKIVIGLIDKNSQLGREYEARKKDNKFYADAHFHSVGEITELLKKSGFADFNYWQTISEPEKNKVEEPLPGYGNGSFVVILARKMVSK